MVNSSHFHEINGAPSIFTVKREDITLASRTNEKSNVPWVLTWLDT